MRTVFVATVLLVVFKTFNGALVSPRRVVYLIGSDMEGYE